MENVWKIIEKSIIGAKRLQNLSQIQIFCIFSHFAPIFESQNGARILKISLKIH